MTRDSRTWVAPGLGWRRKRSLLQLYKRKTDSTRIWSSGLFERRYITDLSFPSNYDCKDVSLSRQRKSFCLFARLWWSWLSWCLLQAPDETEQDLRSKSFSDACCCLSSCNKSSCPISCLLKWERKCVTKEEKYPAKTQSSVTASYVFHSLHVMLPVFSLSRTFYSCLYFILAVLHSRTSLFLPFLSFSLPPLAVCFSLEQTSDFSFPFFLFLVFFWLLYLSLSLSPSFDIGRYHLHQESERQDKGSKGYKR